jgi:hydroxyethylthiazole kinase
MITDDLRKVRDARPLVLNITNYVVMNTTANALLAVGASPVMAHAIEEVEELVDISQALVINIGTLSAPWVSAMLRAGKRAAARNVPVVLDPVGCGATRYRTLTAQMLIREIHPAVVRGNASEIRSLIRSDQGGKGVDSLHRPEDILDDARALSASAGCVVSVSGAVDVVVQGNRVARIANGHPMMTKVTGMGCTASAITGAFVGVCDDPFESSAHAMVVMGVAGELSAERASGPGSLQVGFIDALFNLQEGQLLERVKMDIQQN